MLNRVVELPGHLGVNAFQRFVLGHCAFLVTDGVVGYAKVEIRLGQAWSKLDDLFVRLDCFRITLGIVERESEIEMGRSIFGLDLRRLLQCIGGFVVTLHAVVRIAEVLVSV